VRVLIIDDDPTLVALLQDQLDREGHQTVGAYDGETGLEYLSQSAPDLVLLDVMLPGIDGLEVCRRIRAACDASIVFLSVRSEDQDIVDGLLDGGDDYVTKPFSMSELRARIAAISRRRADRHLVYEDGLLYCAPARRLVRRGNQFHTLTPLEAQLLTLLLQSQGETVTRSVAIAQLWPHTKGNGYAYLAALIGKLRSKIEDPAAAPCYIVTVRGRGYRFCPQGTP